MDKARKELDKATEELRAHRLATIVRRLRAVQCAA